MKRKGARRQDLAGIAVCALFGVFAIVRESFDTNNILESLSASHPSYSVAPSPLRSLFDDFETINFYDSLGRNATGWSTPRLVVLSALDLPKPFFPVFQTEPHFTILRTMLYLANDNNPLSSTEDSSARNSHNKTQNSSRAIHFLGLGADGLEASSIDKRRNPTMEMSEFKSTDANDRAYRSFEREWYEDCVPVTESGGRDNRDSKVTAIVWSTCNVFHELDVVKAYGSLNSDGISSNKSAATIRQRESHIELLGQGSWRSVWKLTTGLVGMPQPTIDRNTTGQQQHAPDPDLVLKLLHTHHNYDDNSFSIHQIDALVMEALSASDYVVDSFGFCGQSVITEAATTSGRSLIKNQSLSSIDRLRIARDLARGLADLHSLMAHPWESSSSAQAKVVDPSPPLVFAHHDVNPANLITVQDGQIQWNDFNLGLVNRQYSPQKRNEAKIGTSNVTECPVPVRYEQILWRSPEECHNHLGTLFLDRDGTGRNTASQAADVYSLGNILFYVLARHQPWSHLEEDGLNQDHHHNGNKNSTSIAAKLSTGDTPERKRESLLAIGEAKIAGKLPNLPERYRKRPGAKILWEAVQMCYTHDPRLRPQAHEVAEFLGTAHARLLRHYDAPAPKPGTEPRENIKGSPNTTMGKIER